MFFKQQWQFKPTTSVSTHFVQPLLVVGERSVVEKRLARETAFTGITRRACWGEQFATDEAGHFIINPEHTADWIALFENVAPVPGTILFFSDGCSWSPQQLLARLCALTQALMKTKSETVRVLFCYGNDAGNATFSALDAFFKSIAIEQPAYTFQAIGIDFAGAASSLPVVLATELAQETAFHHVRYIDGKRHVPRLSMIDAQLEQDVDKNGRIFRAGFKAQGTYLITGGMGALGFLFAAHITQTYNATVILCGRSALDDDKAARLKSLGPQVSYVQADLANKTQCENVFNAIKRDRLQLDGVLHSAGTLHDKLITGVNVRDIEQVLDAKVNATENIIRNLNADSLDFLVLFSSWAGVTGNEGQSIYAYGNAYLNYRAGELAEQLPNINKVIAVAWPLWHGEGMGNQREIQEKLLATTGMVPMQAAQGITAFSTALNHEATMLACFSGTPKNLDIEQIVFSFNRELPETTFDQPLTAQVIRECERFLRNLLAQESGLTPAEIDKDRAFEQLGLDSIMIGRLNRQLSTSFHDLPKTLFFECQNLAELTQWFVAKRAQHLSRMFASGEPENLHNRDISPLAVGSNPAQALDASRKKAFHQFQQYLQRNESVAGRFTPVEKPSAPASEPIAIIGCSGRYPQADTLDAFWQNLLQGHDAISEIPPERWEHQGYFDPEGRDGKTYAKWGGFINDVEMFDPLFFNLSPKDAAYLDPQDRIFLQSAWHTLEDAGYTRSALKGKSVGVYLGVMWGQYQLYGPALAERGDYRVPASSYASIANRVSYFMDFTGPSIALDTMCSSSLTALHLACESLRNGECNYALVGGVNLSIHPQKYLYLGQGKFPSSDGRCRSFGDGGDGYVPGEGVGSVLLKPLSAAIADQDNIHGVILGSAVNHGGKTNGYTVPNPKAQTSVIAAAFGKARIDPASISYIECHGTGTSLGDPIEIAGLENIFGNSRTVDNPIVIGSVKSNIGHLEAAAGMASLSKVLLQFNARTLVPSLHSSPPNSNISFAQLPFKVQTSVEEWSSNNSQPRRACISSFGAGGANAHVILEEYVSPGDATQTLEGLHLFVLSAKTHAALDQYVDCYQKALVDGNLRDASIADICFSSQVAREAFDYRLAIVVESKQELLEKLGDYKSNSKRNTDIYSGNTKSSQLRELLATELVSDGQGLGDNITTALLKDVIAKRNQWHQLAKLWVNGLSIDWTHAYINHTNNVSKIRLPVYPFAKEYCWLDLQKLQSPAISALPPANRHSLAGENISTFYQQKYRFVFDKNSYFINDHRFENQPMLPGAALVEMAVVAANSAVDALVNEVFDIHWLAPVVVRQEPKALEMAFNLETDFIHFRLYDAANPLRLFSEGKIRESSAREISLENFEAVYARCDKSIDAIFCYQLLEHYGLAYGDHFKTIQELRLGEQELLARIAFNKIPADQGLQNLHVCLLDGALQAVIGFIEKETLIALAADPLLPVAITHRLLPKSIAKLTFTGPLPSTFWVHIHQHVSDAQLNDLSFDIDIIDMQGQAIARISDFALAPVNKASEYDELAYWVPAWKSSNTPPARDLPVIANCLVIDSAETLRAQLLESGLALNATAVIPAAEFGSSDAVHSDKTLDLTRADKVAAFLDQSGEPDVVLINTAAILIDQNNYGAAVSRALQASYTFVRALLSRTEKPLRFIVLSPNTAQHAALAASLRGLYSTAAKEFSHFSFKIIEVATDTVNHGLVDNSLPGIIRNELSVWNPEENCVRFTPEGNRTVRYLKEFQALETNRNKITVSGHYLITGGAGSLGFTFAKHLAQRGAQKITLVGRRAADAAINSRLNELTALGIEARYNAVDLSESAAVHALVASLLREGLISGVIHSAGYINDGLIRNKPVDVFMQVIASKVAGTINLLEAFAEHPPQFFAAFSSVTAIQGNTGQADYAAANAFMDEYLTSQSVCPNVISINWPLWEDGMQVDEKSLAYLKNLVGMYPLPSHTGTAIFDQLLNLDVRQPVVLYGNKILLQEYFSPKKTLAINTAIVNNSPLVSLNPEQQVKHYLYEKISTLLGLERARIRGDVSLEDYGVDSATTINLMAILEKDFGKLGKTLLFEFPTINELVNYFVREHHDAVIGLSNNTNSDNHQLTTSTAQVAAPDIAQGVKTFAATEGKKLKFQSFDKPKALDSTLRDSALRDIAIIGVAGRYPNAANLEEFWENLKAGQDSISEIPVDRWDHGKYFDSQSNQDGKIYAKWGGFINDIDAFDAFFFKISPREAELMDPQERLFLQAVWHTLEDAGYPASSLAKRKVGIFVGAMWNQYQLLGQNRNVGEAGYLAPNSSVASIANRVSYAFDFCGPSLSLDSMCSSSLSGLHLACESIARGESELAIAGGVNLNLHENKYFQLSQNRFLASDGRCRSFGAGGDGYVPGEGVGAVLLKPLADALRDGDRIQGVILGSAINHGGKTKGYTVPSPSAQAEVIRAALSAANVRPQDVSYIEAHGTGTALGDPIEIEGLARALRTDTETEARGAIAIGSVKSNIGHLEGAAGVAALSKVILQFKHGQLAASLHSEPENPNIDFSNSPFTVQKKLSVWQDRERKPGVPYGRISGISSFGAGGSNAHVIVADYLHKLPRKTHPDSRIPGGRNIFLLSAKDHQGLLRCSENLFRTLSRDVDQFDLDDICFTLQTGREHFQHRLAIVCSTIGELLIKLEDFCFSKANEGDIFSGDSESDSSEGSSVSIEQFDADTVALGWVNGARINWSSLYKSERPQRIGLPGYPFNRDRYWYGQGKDNKPSANPGTWNDLQFITADETSSQLTASISAASDFVVDHRIHGQVMLPGAVYFELVRSALLHAPVLQQALPMIPNAIRHIAWSLPFSGSEEPLAIQLTRSSAYDHTGVGFTLTHANGELCRGQLFHSRDVAAVSRFSLTEYERSIADGDLYQLFSRNGFIYGPSLQVLKKVYYQDSHAIGELVLPPTADTESGWSPAAIDGAFQTCLALHLTSEGSIKHSDIRYIPLSLGEIVFSQPISQRLFVMVTRKAVADDEQPIGANSFMTKFDVKCVNESGVRIFTISDFTVIGRSVAAVKKKMRDTKPLLFRTVWEHSN